MAQCKCGAINEYQEEPYTCRDCRNDGVLPKPMTDPPYTGPSIASMLPDIDRVAALDKEIVLAAVAFVHERGQLAVQQRVKELCRLVVERDNMVTRPEDIEAAEALKQEYKKVQKDLWERLGKLPPAIRAKIEADL